MDYVTESSLADYVTETLNAYVKTDDYNSTPGIYTCPDITSDATVGIEMLDYIKQRNTSGIVMAQGTSNADNNFNIYVIFYVSAVRNFIIKTSKLGGGVHIMYRLSGEILASNERLTINIKF